MEAILGIMRSYLYLRKDEPVRGKNLFRFLLISLVVFALTSLATALPTGISGHSGNPATNGGATCTSCHSMGTAPSISLKGPTSVQPGSINTYVLAVTGISGNGGLDVSATTGTFSAGPGTQVLNGEITHTAAVSGTSKSWTFTWAAPQVTSTTQVTMYGSATDSYSGGTAKITLP